MADKRAIAAGSTMTGANWHDGLVPVAGDNLHANGFAMTMAVDHLGHMFTTANAGISAAAGGSFTCSTDGVTITGNVTSGSSVCLVVSNTVGTTVTWNGNAQGSNTANIAGANFTGTGTLNHTGTKTSGTGGTSALGLQKVTGIGGTLNTTGAAISATGSTATGLVAGSSGTVNQIGDCTGSPNAAGAGVSCTNASAILNITGHLTAGASSTGTGGNFSAGTVNHDGNVTAAGGHGCSVSGACNYYNTNPANVATGSLTVAGTYGINGTTTGDCWFYGEARGGNAVNGSGFACAAAGEYRVGTAVGNNYPNDGLTSPVAGSFTNGNTFTIKVRRLKFGSGGVTPIVGRHYILDDVADNQVLMRQSNAGTITTLGDVAADYPDEADVRDGEVYDFGAKTGTCAVPVAASVLVGVPVDATVGTAAVSASDIQTACEAALAAYNAATESDVTSARDVINVNTDFEVAAAVVSVNANVDAAETAINSNVDSEVAAAVTAVNANTDAEIAALLATLQANLATMQTELETAIDNGGIEPVDVWNVLQSAVTVANTMGSRLKKCATSTQVGEIVSARKT